MAYVARTIRRKGVHEAKIGGGFKPIAMKKVAIAKPRAMKMPKLKSYFTKGHVF
jgi:hypothetical protein